MKDEKQALVPRLRFPEFRDAEEWEIKSLGDVCNVLQGYGFPTKMQGKHDGEYPFCKVSDVSKAVAENGGLLDDAANYVGNEELSTLRAKLIPVGSTVFAKIGEALRLNRRAYVNRECLIDNNVVGLKAVDGAAEDYFIYISSQLIDLNKHCGGAVPSVNKTTLEAIEVVVPSPEEQQKIADCLLSLDTLIAAQADKIKALKTHKKGLMQQLFSREGETVPRLRFPEFRDAGEWRYEKAELLFSNRIEQGQDGLPIYSVTMNDGMAKRDSLDRKIDNISESSGNKKAHKHDIIYNMMRMWQGASGVAVEDCMISPAYVVLAPRDSICTEFFGYLFKTHQFLHILTAHSQGLTKDRLRLYFKDFARILLPSPSVEEQRKIADCLSSLDEEIAVQTEKFDSLKTHKEGIMQQLFPNPEAVGE